MDPKFPLVSCLQKQCAGSGDLGDIGSHATDLALYLNGNIDEAVGRMTTFIKQRALFERMVDGFKAIGGKQNGRVTVDDDANFLAQFRNGSVEVLQTSRFVGGRRNCNTFHIYGSKGSLTFNLENMNELGFYDPSDRPGDQGFKKIIVSEDIHPHWAGWWPRGHFIGCEHTFIHAVLDFLTCLEKDRMPQPSFREGLKTQSVLDAMERSASSRHWERPYTKL